MTRPRTYVMLVELHSGSLASLTIVKGKDSVGAQLRSFCDHLKQFSFQVAQPNFENADIWTLLSLVERGFQRVHGISYEYSGPADRTKTVDEWGAEMEARANDPRFHAFQKPGEKAWFFGVHSHDLSALPKEARTSRKH